MRTGEIELSTLGSPADSIGAGVGDRLPCRRGYKERQGHRARTVARDANQADAWLSLRTQSAQATSATGFSAVAATTFKGRGIRGSGFQSIFEVSAEALLSEVRLVSDSKDEMFVQKFQKHLRSETPQTHSQLFRFVLDTEH